MMKPGMPPAEIDVIDRAIKLQLDLLRHSSVVESSILAVLEQMRRELIAKLSAVDLTTFGKARLNELLKESTLLIAAYYKQAQAILAPTYDVVSGISAAQTVASVAATTSMPSRTMLETLIKNTLIEGSPAAQWWTRMSADTAFKFSAAIRQGIIQGETQTAIYKRVNLIAELSKRNSKALVHTAVMQVASDANMAVLEANADVAPEVRWLSTLDIHTCWSAETLILMADGTQKPASDIRIGDMVIGGVTGKPCRVVDTGSRIVASSVVIHYNGQIIGRVTHDHPVLTESGWEEIGSVSLSADISERQVLCRVFRAPEATFCGASEICGGRGAIFPPQRDQEAWRACDDDTRHESYSTRSICDGHCDNLGTPHESPARLQHDGRRGRCAGSVTRNIESDGDSAVETLQRRCGIQGEDARNTYSYWRATVDKVARILGITRRTTNDNEQNEFCIMEREERCQQSTQANTRSTRKIEHSSKSAMDGCRIPHKNECSTGDEASRTACHESRMGCRAHSENVRYHEGEVGRSCISCEDVTAGNYPAHNRSTEGRTCKTCMDTRKACGSGGENAPAVGEKEGVTIGIITGVEDHNPVAVFNFTVEDDHSYVAGGIIVHNCQVCGPRDGLEWDTITKEPIGHDMPWISTPAHFGCRCKILGVTKYSKMGSGQRAAAGGPVDRKVTFTDFLARQTPEWQDKNLGAGRADLYRRGVITLRDVASGGSSPLTLEQLKARYP